MFDNRLYVIIALVITYIAHYGCIAGANMTPVLREATLLICLATGFVCFELVKLRPAEFADMF